MQGSTYRVLQGETISFTYFDKNPLTSISSSCIMGYPGQSPFASLLLALSLPSHSPFFSFRPRWFILLRCSPGRLSVAPSTLLYTVPNITLIVQDPSPAVLSNLQITYKLDSGPVNTPTLYEANKSLSLYGASVVFAQVQILCL